MSVTKTKGWDKIKAAQKHNLWLLAKDKGLLHFGRSKTGGFFDAKDRPRKKIDARKEGYDTRMTGRSAAW